MEPKLVHFDDGVQYLITFDDQGNKHKILQIVLTSRRMVSVDQNSVCWCSDRIRLKSNGSFFARILHPPTFTISEAVNEASGPGIISLAQSSSGDIICLKPLPAIGFYCVKDSFLCANSKVLLQSKILPLTGSISLMTMMNSQLITTLNFIKSSNEDGAVMLQSPGAVFKKQLRVDESINVALSSIIAFEETCKISIVNMSSSGSFGMFLMLHVEGPGIIYFSPKKQNQGPVNDSGGRGFRYSNLSAAGMLLHFLTMILSFYTLTMLLFRMEFHVHEIPAGENQQHIEQMGIPGQGDGRVQGGGEQFRQQLQR